MPAKEKKSNTSGNKSLMIGIIGCAVAIIIVLVVVVVILLNKYNNNVRKNDVPEENKRNVVVNESNVESVVDGLVSEAASYVEPGYYTVNMNTEWHFSKGDAVSDNARVDNLAENTNDVYFDVFLAEDESEPIYQSPVIPRGSFLEYIALDKVLNEGKYDCVIVYHLIDDNQNTISTLRVAFTIVVES